MTRFTTRFTAQAHECFFCDQIDGNHSEICIENPLSVGWFVTCSVCGSSEETGNVDEPLCEICFDWQIRLGDPQLYETLLCASVPVGELTWECQEVMIEAIERWIA